MEQRTAAGEAHAPFHDVGGEFGRGLVEGRLHGITDRSDGLFERFTRKGEVVERTGYAAGQKDGPSVKRTTGAKAMEEEGRWSTGKRVGPWRFYHPDGALQREGEYADGLEQGEWIRYFDNGKRESVGRFEAGRAVGQWSGYYRQGERRFVGQFVDGVLSGPYTEWWPSGQLRAEGTYEKGLNEGDWKFWSREGQLDTTRSGRYLRGELAR